MFGEKILFFHVNLQMVLLIARKWCSFSKALGDEYQVFSTDDILPANSLFFPCLKMVWIFKFTGVSPLKRTASGISVGFQDFEMFSPPTSHMNQHRSIVAKTPIWQGRVEVAVRIMGGLRFPGNDRLTWGWFHEPSSKKSGKSWWDSEVASIEPRIKPSQFPFYWLLNRYPYNGLS